MEIEVRHLLVPTRDGTKLSGVLHRPTLDRPVPVVVEYTPYRAEDFRGAARDFGHIYLAERGIASVQLDVRGTGSSEGIADDEYQFPQEQQDGYDALEWLARQEWANGRTGLWGTSYAGFTALQIAQLQPPSLGAIAPIYATDDRYSDDMHFRGGALNGWSVIGPYALGMVTRNALPPSPAVLGERWREVWNARLDRTVPWLIRWIEEQLDGPYWRSALGRRYHEVSVPTLVIGGWADFYASASIRWFAHLRVPKRLIMGPWPHTPPDVATPGPRIDFMREVARWFRHWLADEPTGVLDEPPVMVYIQHSRRPDASTDAAPGVWRYEDALPPTRAGERVWFLGARGDLAASPPLADFVAERAYVPFVGFADAGFGGAGGWGEQGANDAFSITFTSKPLAGDLEILGIPRARLFASTDAAVACWAVRLCDVAPDGASTLVTKGLLNGTRRDGLDRAEPLAADVVYPLQIDLDAISWVFPRGHRMRLSISGADFPEVWPTPLRATLRVHAGSAAPSALLLPVVPPSASPYPAPAPPPPPARRSRFQHTAERTAAEVTYDVLRRRMSARKAQREALRAPDGAAASSEHRVEMHVSATDPADVFAAAVDRRRLQRGGLEVEAVATAGLRGAAAAFDLDLTLELIVDGAVHRRYRWTKSIPRRLL